MIHHFRYRSIRNLAIREAEYVRSYNTSREDLITQAVQQIKAMRVQCEDDCERVRDAVRFDERRAQQHARLIAMKIIRLEKNVRECVCLCVCVCASIFAF